MIYFWQETLSSEFTHFFRRFFWTEKQNVQTFLLIGCICWLWSFICSYPCFACFWLGFLWPARCLFVNLLCIIAVRLGDHKILAWASLPQIWYSANQSVKGVKSRGWKLQASVFLKKFVRCQFSLNTLLQNFKRVLENKAASWNNISSFFEIHFFNLLHRRGIICNSWNLPQNLQLLFLACTAQILHKKRLEKLRRYALTKGNQKWQQWQHQSAFKFLKGIYV